MAITSGEDVSSEAAQGSKVTVFADRTPFYATMGGQHRGLWNDPDGLRHRGSR